MKMRMVCEDCGADIKMPHRLNHRAVEFGAAVIEMANNEFGDMSIQAKAYILQAIIMTGKLQQEEAAVMKSVTKVMSRVKSGRVGE